MKWETPSFTDLRFGFEVTMYIYNRKYSQPDNIVGFVSITLKRGFNRPLFFA